MNKENNTVKVLLIRHAESMFNKGQRVACDSEVEVLEGSECLETKFSAKLLDCSITKEGYKQCERGREICLKEDIAIVYVSPLRRALETCEQIFKNHPSQPKIIPHPLFREMVLSNCDIGARVLESKEIYKNHDFSFLKDCKYPNLWCIYGLLDQEKSAQIIKEIEEKCNGDKDEVIRTGHLKLLEMLRGIYPDAIESKEESIERTKHQKDLIQTVGRTLPKGKKIAVVGHSRTLHAFTTETCPITGQQIIGKWFENGEVFEYEISLE